MKRFFWLLVTALLLLGSLFSWSWPKSGNANVTQVVYFIDQNPGLLFSGGLDVGINWKGIFLVEIPVGWKRSQLGLKISGCKEDVDTLLWKYFPGLESTDISGGRAEVDIQIKGIVPPQTRDVFYSNNGVECDEDDDLGGGFDWGDRPPGGGGLEIVEEEEPGIWEIIERDIELERERVFAYVVGIVALLLLLVVAMRRPARLVIS